MIHEIDFYGILLSPLLAAFITGWLALHIGAYYAEKHGFYKYVAQRAIFDAALLVILTGAAALIISGGWFS